MPKFTSIVWFKTETTVFLFFLKHKFEHDSLSSNSSEKMNYPYKFEIV